MDCWYYSPFPESFWRCPESGDVETTDARPSETPETRRGEDETTKALSRRASDDEGDLSEEKAAPSSTPACERERARTDGATRSSKPAKLYACEFCLKYVRKKKTLAKHKAAAASLRHPPETRFTASRAPSIKTRARRNPKPPCSRWTARKRPCTARTCVCCPSCS